LETLALKTELKRRHDWTLSRAFDSVDVARDGYVSFSSLLNFLKINGYHPSETEVIAIVRRLDCDADQRIEFEEFRLLFGDDELKNLRMPSSPRNTFSPASALKGTSPMRQKNPSPRRVIFEEKKTP
jgi:hypothetical protein